jgi:glycosyltransferase involved in cell wall biosynthesis
MKIIYIHQYYNSPAMPGSTRSYEMAKGLVLLGHEIEIITSTRGLSKSNDEFYMNEDGIRINWINVNYSNKMGFYRRIFAFLNFSFFSFWKAIKLEGDIIFASSTPLTVALPGILAARYKRVPFYFEVRDLWPEIPIAMGYLRNPIFRYLALKLEKYSYQNSKGIVALSEGMKEGIVKRGYPKDRVIVIPNGCDIKLFDLSESKKDSIRVKYGFKNSDIILLYPGTFGVVNNLEWLVDLANKFHSNINLKFLLVGGGKEKGLILNKAKRMDLLNKNLFIFNEVPKKDMPEIFFMSDIVVSTILPLKELEANSANKFFDALASGKCIIINHGGWQENDLIAYKCGYRIPRNLDDAYKKLSSLIDDPILLAEMGRNARILGLNKYSRDKLVKKLAFFLQE